MPDKRTTIDHQFDQQVIERINLFATDTIKKIFQHISRLKIGESTGTGALADSIRAVVHTNAPPRSQRNHDNEHDVITATGIT